MITFQCENPDCPGRRSGEIYHADEAHIGRFIACRHCGRFIKIGFPSSVEPIGQTRPIHTPTEATLTSPPPRSPGGKYTRPSPLRRRSILAAGVAALVLFVGVGFLSWYKHAGTGGGGKGVAPTTRPAAYPAPKPQPAASPHPQGSGPDVRSGDDFNKEFKEWEATQLHRPPTPPTAVQQWEIQSVEDPAPALQRPPTPPRAVQRRAPDRLIPLAELPELPCEIRFVQNGENLKTPEKTMGLGIIAVNNGTPQDAIVKVVPESTPKQSARFVYISAGKQVDISKLDQGNYAVWFCQGGGLAPNWCGDRQQFRDYHRCARFEQPLDFREEKRGNTQFWDQYTLTLHKVPGGNAPTEDVSRASFDEIK